MFYVPLLYFYFFSNFEHKDRMQDRKVVDENINVIIPLPDAIIPDYLCFLSG